MERTTRLMGVLAGAIAAGAASAQTFNLTSDYSETNNPNWLWSFANSGSLLQKFTPSLPNAMNGAAGNGFWSFSASSDYETSILKVTADGPAVGYSTNDFLAGDVCVHGSNPGHGRMEVRWGGSVRGSVTVSGRTWYAHSVVNRVAVYELTHNSAVLASGQLTPATHRGNPVLFSGGGPVTLQAGDSIALALLPAPGQIFASFAGVDLTVNFTPHACPPDLTFGAIPGQPGYGLKNGIANNDDFFYYLAQFAAGNVAVADLTTGAIPGQPGYGVPNGIINNDDFFFYLSTFAAGC